MKKIMFMLLIAMMLLGLLYAPAMAEEMGGEALTGEFYTWDDMGSCAGAAAVVAMITQLTKGLPYISKIPTQLWSWILSALVLLASMVFTGQASLSNAFLALGNALVVGLVSNGGYTLITRTKKTVQGMIAEPAEAAELHEAPLLVEEVDLDISTWTLEQLKAFCVLNQVPAEFCQSREDYMQAIENYLNDNGSLTEE